MSETIASGASANLTDAQKQSFKTNIGIPDAATKTIFSSNGTFTVPDGALFVYVELWGGGGGGSCVDSTGQTGYGAGAGGGYSSALFKASDLTSTVGVTVGSGGSGGVLPTNNGNDGGISSFSTYAYVTGGRGGRQNTATEAIALQNNVASASLTACYLDLGIGDAISRAILYNYANNTDSGGFGGNAFYGSNVSLTGGWSNRGGGGGGSCGASNSALNYAGGNSNLAGNGGGGGTASGSPAGNGGVPAGGGGAGNGVNGGNGGNGRVIVYTW